MIGVARGELAVWHRFDTKMQVGSAPEDCWEWIGSRHPRGYGGFFDGSRVVRAHRWAYERFVGPIDEGMVIDHLCRNTGCVNPDHLDQVTQRENVLRGNAPAATQARRTHCIRGHELSGANVYMNPGGRRQCKACRRETDRRRNARG